MSYNNFVYLNIIENKDNNIFARINAIIILNKREVNTKKYIDIIWDIFNDRKQKTILRKKAFETITRNDINKPHDFMFRLKFISQDGNESIIIRRTISQYFQKIQYNESINDTIEGQLLFQNHTCT